MEKTLASSNLSQIHISQIAVHVAVVAGFPLSCCLAVLLLPCCVLQQLSASRCSACHAFPLQYVAVLQKSVVLIICFHVLCDHEKWGAQTKKGKQRSEVCWCKRKLEQWEGPLSNDVDKGKLSRRKFIQHFVNMSFSQGWPPLCGRVSDSI